MTDPLTGRPERPRVEGTGRLEAFSDGVIAIVVTLLVLELRLPEVEGHANEAFLEAFGAVMPKFISFAVSFAIVAIFWVNHHHFFSRVTHTDWKLLWLNNILLFFLAVTPFSTAVLGDHPLDAIPIAFYGINLALAGREAHDGGRDADGDGLGAPSRDHRVGRLPRGRRARLRLPDRCARDLRDHPGHVRRPGAARRRRLSEAQVSSSTTR